MRRVSNPAASAPVLLAPVLLALAFLLPACRPGEEERPVFGAADIQARLGLDGVHDDGRWDLLTIRLTNRGADFDGTVGIRGGTGVEKLLERDPVTYRLATAVPSGQTRQLSIPVLPQGWTHVEVTLSDGRSGWRRLFELPDGDAPLRVLVIGDRAREAGALRAWLRARAAEIVKDVRARAPRPTVYFGPGVTVQTGGETGEDAGDGDMACRLTAVRPEDLADSPAAVRALDSFQIVILDGSTLAGLPRSLSALSAWVEGGGTLLAFPGSGWGAGLPEELRELLAVRPGDPRAPVPAPLQRVLEGEAARGFFYRELEPAGPATLARGGLTVEARRGLGRTVAFSIAPGGPFPAPGEAAAIYDVLDDAVKRVLDAPGPHWLTSQRFDSLCGETLFQGAGLRIPTQGQVALGLALYLLLGFIVPAFIFSRLRRREWTFVTIVVASVLAIVGIYRFGLLSAREALELDEISIVRLPADGGPARVTSYLGLVSPRVERVSIRDAGGDGAAPGDGAVSAVLPQPLRILDDPWTFRRRRREEPRVTIEADPLGRLRVAPLTLFPNGMRLFRHDSTVGAARVRDLLDVAVVGGAGGGSGAALRIRNPGSSAIGVGLRREGGGLRLVEVRPSGEVVLGPPKAGGIVADPPGIVADPPGRMTHAPDVGNVLEGLCAAMDPVHARWAVSPQVSRMRGDLAFATPSGGGGRPITTHVIAVVAEPIFPASSAFAIRRGTTVFVIELP